MPAEVAMWIRLLFAIGAFQCGLSAQAPQPPPELLPAAATQQLAASLEAASAHQHHVWRDTPPMRTDGTVNAYIEISRHDRRKWELDMRSNTRAIDRVIPEDIGGYPVNYGFVPQTVSYDGDPFDALVLGPPLDGGQVVRGVIVGFMYMEDEKGLDSKVVLSLVGENGRPLHQLTERDRTEMAEYFRIYKRHEPGKFSKVPGWGTIEEGRAYVRVTHAFFRECRMRSAAPCRVRSLQDGIRQRQIASESERVAEQLRGEGVPEVERAVCGPPHRELGFAVPEVVPRHRQVAVGAKLHGQQ
jgi:inorganic pyrophosphatase